MVDRAAFYIDGFNLYHAIDDLQTPHLKWLNLWDLANRLIRKDTEQLVKVAWCSALFKTDAGKMIRHRTYQRALESVGVDRILGHFTQIPHSCDACGSTKPKFNEKEGDVNVAIHLINDAHLDIFDVAYLVTADSDQAATAKMLSTAFPKKKLIAVAPPDARHSQHILQYAHGKISIEIEDLEYCIFPKAVLKDGAPVCTRPSDYDPPVGWKNPNTQKVVLAKKNIAPGS